MTGGAASRKQTDAGSAPRRRLNGAITLGLWPAPRGAWLPVSAVALLICGHLLYGGLVSDIAMALEIAAALLLSAALLNRRFRVDLGRLRGLGIPSALFVLVILIGLWSLTPWTPGGPHPVWAYVGVVPGASTIDKSSTLVEIIKLLGLACFFALGLIGGAQDDRARFAVRLTIWSSVALGVWAFGAFITHSTYQTSGRLEARFLSPNTAGLFFGSVLLIALAEAAGIWRRARPSDRIEILPVAAAALVLSVCLIATASRGAFAGAFAGGGAYVLLQVWTGRLKARGSFIWIGAFLAAALGLIVFAGGQLVDRITHTQGDAISRLDIWRAHWGAFLDSPVFGYGLGAEKTVNRTLLSAANFDALWNIKAILNVYLQWLENAGVVGALPMFACLAVIIARTLLGNISRTRMTGLLAGLLAADVLVLFQGATDFGLDVYSVAAFWSWLLGLQFALSQGSSQR